MRKQGIDASFSSSDHKVVYLYEELQSIFFKIQSVLCWRVKLNASTIYWVIFIMDLFICFANDEGLVTFGHVSPRSVLKPEIRP